MAYEHIPQSKRTHLERAEKFISSLYFTDVNLFGRLYPFKWPVKSIHHYAASNRVSYDEAVKADYEEASVGQSFGPMWSTHWFRVSISLPTAWIGKKVHLIWDSNSEAMVWKNGLPLQGLTNENKRSNFLISKNLNEIEIRQEIYIEMACNGLFGKGAPTMISPPDLNAHFALARCEMVVEDESVQELLIDFELLIDMVQSLPEDCNRSYQALYTANQMINSINFDERQTLMRAHELALSFFQQKNGISQHKIIAIGHCHIDTAWLWPYAETIRKCARSWSSTIGLMKEYPEFKFACSQAQQFLWIKQHYPELYSEIKSFIDKGQFIPVGGTWVEMDCNIPSGESMIRQFLYGQRFFQEEFGKKCDEFWLPDTFGYSAQLPQIMKLVGIKRFLTQKISWNLINKFPYHTFWWKGLDNTKVLTHFPPGDSYEMKCNISEVMKTINNFKDKGRSNQSMFLFGYGDGGQGPTKPMLEKLRRITDVDGLPKVQIGTPEEFFQHVEENDKSKLCTWTGELYLELHNGTYTTHALMKKRNRFCEYLFCKTEMLSVIGFLFKRDNLKIDFCKLWRDFLLNQFHDVIPGTSINEVYKDAHKIYDEINNELSDYEEKMINNLLTNADTPALSEKVMVLLNTLSWSRKCVMEFPNEYQNLLCSKLDEKVVKPSHQKSKSGSIYAMVQVPSYGFYCPQILIDFEPVTVHPTENDLIVMSNSLVSAWINKQGGIVKLTKKGCDRNYIKEGNHANQMVMFDDIPMFWDAWDVMDYHLETRKPLNNITSFEITEDGPLRCEIQFQIRISEKSAIVQKISLDAESPYLKFENTVDWYESHKLLKVEFPFDITCTQASYEIQYGHIKRNTHTNTSWDYAQLEVCGHKWADLSEFGFGVAVLNDSKYGWSCFGSTLYLSLLRSSKSPDDEADMERHTFTYAIMPHRETFQEARVIQASYEINNPLTYYCIDGSRQSSLIKSYLNIDNPAIILETFKVSEDKEFVIMRLYESFGGKAQTKITLNFHFNGVTLCNGLEEDTFDDVSFSTSTSEVFLDFKAFEIISLKIHVLSI